MGGRGGFSKEMGKAGGLGGLLRELGVVSYIGFMDLHTFGDDNNIVGYDSHSPGEGGRDLTHAKIFWWI